MASMQQGIKKLQGFEYLKVVFLEILNAELCQVFANQVTYRTRRNIGENNIWRNTTQNHFGGLNVGDFIKLYLYAHIILMCVCRR